MVNRIKELRQRRRLSQQKLADRLHAHRQTVAKLEGGDMQLTADWMGRIAAVLDVAPRDLIDDQGSLTVPLTHIAASAFSETGPDAFDLAAPHRRLEAPPGLKNPEECFAAAVADDHASRLYPQGSTLIVRRFHAGRENGAGNGVQPLIVGRKVLVRHFVRTRGERATMEILAGVLDRTMAGDLVLLTRTMNRAAPASVVIQAAPPTFDLRERLAPVAAADPVVAYRPKDDDPAEIMGQIVMAITPE